MTRQRNDEQRKREIREAATRCFVRQGYEARLLDIAREAGLSKGGIYFHYATKEALFHDILDKYATLLEARWDFEPVADQPADRTISRLVVAHLRTMQDEPNEVRLYNLLVAMAAQEEVFREKLDEIQSILRNLYKGAIERGITEGVFAPGDTDALATSVLAYINGLGSLSAASETGRLPVTPELGAEQVLRMLKVRTRASSVEFAAPTEFVAADPKKQPN
ncbi:transcriptional regulator, TetR family protein [Plesiocystis pacifica SIR-1]|uniref:Transcriptional regulator, TetR family protein n=1 Tax=Plesiocystis pacifica SIR-1 TaxID=391625 RepID=A6G9V2_9BACT|nr:TetR/AcrR family transcriptional regulator [Plesiocystis pacifica]EDM77388.1 transcriptional regulator, TetR family protein [Plesiocystis pacifica SIR-1]